jgi:hypothetical protein
LTRQRFPVQLIFGATIPKSASEEVQNVPTFKPGLLSSPQPEQNL